MPTIYNSRDKSCKLPFGAVPCGQEISLTIHLPKMHLSESPALKLFEIDRWDAPILMQMQLSGSDELVNSYSISFTLNEPKLYMYYFELLSEGKIIHLKNSGNGKGILDENAQLWQLTVYHPEMQCPSFLREGMLYQIFPDRFYASGEQHANIPYGRTLREDWGAIPIWRPNEKGVMTNSDFFGGDLRGIEEKLPYLESLGVTAIYLNPIFESHSNHRYDVADYKKIDPLLGTNDDFKRLCKSAKEKGISIILDGVFSHTGSDSLYFNKEKRYGDHTGAYNDPNSPYREWYNFIRYPDEYESWWGFLTLPNVIETNPAYLEYICGTGGVLAQWLEYGASGYRLDVADELPDAFLDELHRSVKGHTPDACVIGEVWEDASNKVSYGVRRRYLLGSQLDSVMNYPFKDALISYMRWGNHQLLYDVIMQILENYPKPAIQSLMNSLSTHDTVRVITALAGQPLEHHDRAWQEAHHFLDQDAYRHGCRLFMLASILQFGLPGLPCVYYGDEAGMTGYRDPFNRVCYPWGKENKALVSLIRSLGIMRKDYKIFAEAEFVPFIFSKDICVFIRAYQSTSILFGVNRSDTPQKIEMPVPFGEGEPIIQCGGFKDNVLDAYSGVVLVSKQ